jgi:hypothetical protein
MHRTCPAHYLSDDAPCPICIIIEMRSVLTELQECAAYWSEYDVPLGIHERIDNAIKKSRGE